MVLLNGSTVTPLEKEGAPHTMALAKEQQNYNSDMNRNFLLYNVIIKRFDQQKANTTFVMFVCVWLCTKNSKNLKGSG